jgi:pimeloyl-ACP methyl ester carboxylesterase
MARILLVQGDRDPLYPIDITIDMFKSIPKSSLWIIPNAGHAPLSAEIMNDFIKAVKTFFESKIA